jgi:ABC-type nitrate/sulfonate/bicarbonate transport system substrate-binding protein
MARELGLFSAQGLDVELSREVGWATVRDKIVLRELEAAHAPAAMVLTNSLGIGCFSFPCVTGLVLNLHGNAITLSNRLSEAGVRDGEGLRRWVQSNRARPKLTLGVAFSSSSHNFLLQKWLRDSGLDSADEVNIVVVPPPQMAAQLKAGNLDGYCVGEPWNSLAALQGAGWTVAASSRIEPCHPEKVLLVRGDFAQARSEEHRRLIATVHAACVWCQSAEHRGDLARILAQPQYLNTSVEAVRRSLCQPVPLGKDADNEVSDFHIFAGPTVNEPGLDKAAWVRNSLIECRVLTRAASPDNSILASMFRSDLFHDAIGKSCAEIPAGAKTA